MKRRIIDFSRIGGLVMGLALSVAAQPSDPGGSEDRIPEAEEIAPVFYVTNRSRAEAADRDVFYRDQRGDLAYGVCSVQQ